MAHASNTRASYGAHVASNTKVVPQHVRNHTRAHDFMLFVIFRSFRFFFFFRGGRRLFSDPSLWIVVTVLEETIMPIHLFGIPWGKKSISVALWSLVRRKTLAGASYYASMPLKYGKKKKKNRGDFVKKVRNLLTLCGRGSSVKISNIVKWYLAGFILENTCTCPMCERRNSGWKDCLRRVV